VETEGRLRELAEGVLVENDVFDIANRVAEYDPNLKIQYCDPEQAGPGDAPYRLMELCRDGLWRKVMDIWTLDATVLERIYAADTQKRDILLGIDKQNLVAKQDQQRRYKEMMEEAGDIMKHVLRSSKSTYTIKDKGKVIKV